MEPLPPEGVILSDRSSSSRFATLVLPAIIMQSLIMGGGYSTGREIVQYAGRFGEQGWLAVGVIFFGFAILSVLAFELARVARVSDYKRWIQQLIGPLWPLFDILTVTMMMLVIAVMSAAMGSILRDTLGLPYALGLAIAFGAVGFLAWKGEHVMEAFKVFGTVVLYLGYLGFAYLVLSSTDAATSVAAAAPSEHATGEVLVSGMLYVGYNLAVFPAVLFCLYRQSKPAETIVSGLLSGFLMTVPFVLTFICLLRFGGRPEVLEAEVPWLQMLDIVTGGSPFWVATFGVVAGWTLLETAVGSIHALVDRIEKNVEDLPSSWQPASGNISPGQRVMISLVVLGAATGLAQFGIIDLVARGYSILAWGFIALLAVPLLTIGVWKIFQGAQPAQPAQSDA